jgi:hypothetical protein
MFGDVNVMILTPSLGCLARLWSVSYSYLRADQPASPTSHDARAFQSYARLAFEAFRKIAAPTGRSPSPLETAQSLVTASPDLIRRWERAIAHRPDGQTQLFEITNVAIATRDRLLQGAGDLLAPLRPTIEEAPQWVREIVVHGGFDLFGDGTSPRDVNGLSSLTGIPPWMTAGLFSSEKTEGGAIASIVNQTPAEIDAQCAWAMQGFRAHFGDAFVDEALKGFRRHPSEMTQSLWENVRACGHYEKMLFSGSAVPTPPEIHGILDEEAPKIRFAIEFHDLKGRRPRSLEVAPILVPNESRGLKLNLTKLGLDEDARKDLVRFLWKDLSLKDLGDLVGFLIPHEHHGLLRSIELDGNEFPFLFDLHSASLWVFLEKKVRQKTLRRESSRFLQPIRSMPR